MLSFISENKKHYPKYFKIKELKNYYLKNELHPLKRYNKIIGFYVLENEKFKSLYIKKDYRTHSKNIIKKMFKELKSKNKILTIAVNNKSKKVKNLALKNGFNPTNQIVKGKTHYLEIYKHERA